MTIRAGQLRERVTLRRSTSTSVAGVPTTAWADVASVRARVKPLGAREARARGVEDYVESYDVTVRSPLPGGVAPVASDRVAYREQEYEVKGITYAERRDYVTLTIAGPSPGVQS